VTELRVFILVVIAAIFGAACGSSAHPPAASPARPGVCGNPGRAPERYRSIVVFAFENRSWNDVGLGFGAAMPYLHSLGQQCSYFTDWTEADTKQNSLSQYVGQITGAPQPGTKNDCSPSSSCSTRADNLFRQASRAGLTAVNYVEGATSPCSAAGNASKHVPVLYLWGADDRTRCDAQVRPLTELDPNALPAFSFITPNLCNDGHDCSNDVVDRWASAHMRPIVSSAAYRKGQVAVFVWYDEDHPVPNLWITRTAARGPIAMRGAGYAGTLKAWEGMLALACLANACSAPDMRARANS
jgi:phosphatidylinositol-3-phosphatase